VCHPTQTIEPEDIGTEKFEKEILDFLELENPNNIKMKHIA
jgi:hypothetical protein